ncbi:carboxypeptidase-like regulatory domain-containing protein [Gangjinia marincola]|uniref:Carboxypeptidase-like regulatory domain-containing protein n=2 Tax=Gangjinia marincola TaxID=578463 RepID=A0ABP3XY85_9FLAO
MLWVLLLCSFLGWSQQTGIKGKVVDALTEEEVPDVEVRIENSDITVETNGLGEFYISGSKLPLGEQVITFSKLGYESKRLTITVNLGNILDLEIIDLNVDINDELLQISTISLADNQLDSDEDFSAYNVSGLLQASRDTYLSAAAFDFSATFFRPRGLDNANNKVLINGIEMNKLFNGRPQWSNWGGLNDIQRNQEFTLGLKANEYTFGDVGGTTNMVMSASQYRKGGRVSYAASDRSYEGRVMASYNSGLMTNGWAYTVMASRRFGEEGFKEGTSYNANSFFASVEKKINDEHSLNLTSFYTPNRRGRATAITQEIVDLKGVRYNPFWGFQDGDKRNARMREIAEPVFMLNHYWNITDDIRLNTNVSYQTGFQSNTRIDNGGTTLKVASNGEVAYEGGARNPDPAYYQNLPSYFLRFNNVSAVDFYKAYVAEQNFRNNGQINWDQFYRANINNAANGDNSVYIIQDDRIEDDKITANMILNARVNDDIEVDASVSYTNLISENFAQVDDLLGGTGFLDVDFFAEETADVTLDDAAQSNLRTPNRIVTEGDRYKYNYEIDATEAKAFAQAQFKYSLVDFYVGGNVSQTTYQRNGLYENGNFPGQLSFGESEELEFTNYGAKAGATYKLTGRHVFDVNGGYYTKAPVIRNSFSNARQNNAVVSGLESEVITSGDVSYIYRSPLVKARLTGYYTTFEDQTEINFFFTNFGGIGTGFLQEVLTGVDRQNFGGELGIEAQVTPTIKLKAAAGVGQFTYTSNPDVYYTTDDLTQIADGVAQIENAEIRFGDGKTYLKDYHIAGGPERAYQIGFEYRDPKFWWIGTTFNHFSNAYIDPSALLRTQAIGLDFDGLPLAEYDEDVAKQLLRQEEFEAYSLVNIVGGKSWRIDDYFVGFFATINNVLDQEFKSGGFEQSRSGNFNDLVLENNRSTPVFGNRYFFGNGRTYYLNLYIRF